MAVAILSIGNPAAPSPDEAAIRSARLASNQAIEQRDLAAYAATITQDFVVTTGAGKFYTRPEFLELWSKQFADAKWGGCTRTTGQIELSTSQPAAAESGRFVCRSTDPALPQLYRGTYAAMWRKEDGQWKTRSELFVTLACEGGAACPDPKR